MVTTGTRTSNELIFLKANTFETVKLTPADLVTMLKKLIERADKVEKKPYEPYRSFVNSLDLNALEDSNKSAARL